MRILDGTPINNIENAITRFSHYAQLSYQPHIWKSTTIKQHFRFSLNILNMMHLSFIMVTCSKFAMHVNMGFDNTTKKQHSYQHVMISGSCKRDLVPESFTIGYVRLYSTSSQGYCDGIKHVVIRLNKFIQIWQDNKELLMRNGLRVLTFKPIDSRITNLRFDRSIVNFATASLLNNDLDLRFHITNEMIFNCTRHDLFFQIS